jgi:outer membrane receptor protein involved in Fe transport
VVTATSPALQGEQIVVTDKTGTFRIPTLPPGEYGLRYEADTFRPYARTGIELRASVTLRVDAELLPETLSAQEVEVVATPPTVDVGTARSGVTLNEDFTRRVPVAPPTGKGGASRSFEQLADVAPTGRNDAFGASLAGTTSVENQYMIDGMSVGDPGFGYNATPLSIDFIKETSIITGGYLPEYGRGGGGVLDVVTKSGSNAFHGSVFGNLSPWQASPKYPRPQDTISTTTRMDNVRDMGFDLGGPLIKDKLWFYVGGLISRQSFDLNRNLYALQTGADGKYIYDSDGLIVSKQIPGTHRESLAEQTGGQYLGKLTYSPTSNDRVELVHRGTPTHSGGNGTYSVDYETGLPEIWGNPGASSQIGPYNSQAWRQVFDSYDTSLKWTHSALNKRLTFDTIVGWHKQHSADLASDGTSVGGGGLSATPDFVFARTNPQPHSITDFETISDPSLCVNAVAGGDARCPVAQYAFGGPQILQDRRFNRYQLRELATYVTPGLGHHVVKAGAEVEYMDFLSKRGYPGGSLYQERANGTQVSDFRRYGGLTAPDQFYPINVLSYKTETVSVGAFVQDSWSIMDKVALNAGFRFDSQALYSDQGIGLKLPNQWSPRIGLIFDPTQKGAAKLFANYAIYYQTIPLNIVDRAGSGEPQVRGRRSLANCDPLHTPNYPKGCDAAENLVTVTSNGASDPNQKWIYLSTGKLAIDPNIKPQSSSEFTSGGEYEIIPGGRLGVTYIRRWMNHIVEDMSRDEGGTYFLGNPGRDEESEHLDHRRRVQLVQPQGRGAPRTELHATSGRAHHHGPQGRTRQQLTHRSQQDPGGRRRRASVRRHRSQSFVRLSPRVSGPADPASRDQEHILMSTHEDPVKAVYERRAVKLVRVGALLGCVGVLVHCGDQPKPNCLTSTASFATKLVELERTGSCESFGPLGFNADPLVGFSAYYSRDKKGQPNYDDGSLAVRTAELGTLAATAAGFDVKNQAGKTELYSFGKFSDSVPNDDDICPVPTLSPTHLKLPALPEVPDDPTTEDEDEGFPGQEAVDITLTWSDIKVYVTAASFGTQVEGTLSDARLTPTGDKCTIRYKTLSLSPAVSCQKTDDKGAPLKNPDGTFQVDPSLCASEANPALGRFTGSGISPNTNFECDAKIGYCVIAGSSVPALK